MSRNRIALAGASRAVRTLNTYLTEPGSLVMERKMLLGIKQRTRRPEVTFGTGEQLAAAGALVPWLSRPGTTAPRSRCAA